MTAKHLIDLGYRACPVLCNNGEHYLEMVKLNRPKFYIELQWGQSVSDVAYAINENIYAPKYGVTDVPPQ